MARAPGAWARVWRRLRPPRRLRFTREGNWFVFLALAIGLAAINTGNNLLYLLLAWLLSFIIASGVLSELTMRGLRVTRRPAPEVWAGQPFLMEIAVENGKAGLASFSIEIEDLIDGRPLDKKCYFLKIPPGKTQRTSYRHTFSRRGRYRFDGFRIATRFPFTLFRKSRDTDDGSEVIVYPRRDPGAAPGAPAARTSASAPATASAAAASSSGCASGRTATIAARSTGARPRAPAACWCARSTTRSSAG
jgi:uncharacterized protein (DUF58 family)